MRILIVGASGRVGRLVVRSALTRGYKVTALVRDDVSFASIMADIIAPTTRKEDLTIFKGQPQAKSDVDKAFVAVANDPPIAVVVTLNSSRTSDNPFAKQLSPPTLMHDSMGNILDAIRIHGTRKLVVLQAHGVGESFPSLFLPIKILVCYSNMGIGYKDHEEVEKLVKQSGMTYVLARPARFVDGPSGPVRTYGNKGEGISSFKTATRETVANFLLDAVEKDDWNNTAPVISN